MMLFGIGNVGGRVAFYALQRGSLPGLRLAAVDADADALALLNGINTVLVPPPVQVAAPAVEAPSAENAPEEGEAKAEEAEEAEETAEAGAEETAEQPSAESLLDTTMSLGLSAAGRTALHEFLDAQFPTLQLLTVVCGLSGEVGGLYGLEAIRYAKERGVACAAVVIMPHPFETEERKKEAVERLSELEALAQAHIVLPCAEMFPLFGNETDKEAFSQGVRWLAECSLGFLRPFATRKNLRRKKTPILETEDNNQLTFVFEDHPMGIFAGCQPTNVDGQNLDIPTWRRRNLEFETEAEMPSDEEN